MLESQIQIHPAIGPQHWRTYGTNTDLLKTEVGSSRGAIHLARITRCLHTWHWETNSDITEWAECRNLLAQWQRSGSIRDTIQARTWFFLEPASEKTWWNGHLNEPQGQWDSVENGWRIQVSHFAPEISSDRAIIAWTIEERRKRLLFPGYIRQQEDSHQDHIGNQFLVYLQSKMLVVRDSKSRTYNENSRRRRANRSGPWAAVIDHARTAERCHKLEATRCCNSQKITRRWFGELPNRQHLVERWKMDNSTLPLNPSWMETALLFCAENTQVSRDFSKVKITSILDNHVKNGPATGIEVFDSVGTLVTEAHVLSRQPGKSRSWVRISRGLEQHARQLIYFTEIEHPNSGAVFSPQSSSWGRAQTQGEHLLWTRSCAKAKAYTHWFQSTRLENNLSKSTAQKGLWILQHLWALHEHFTTRRLSWSWRSSTMDTCFDTQGRCWANSKLEQKRLDWRTQSFHRQIQIWSVVRTKTERVSIRVQYTANVTGLKSIQTWSLWNRYRWIGRNTCSTRPALPSTNQSKGVVCRQEDWV